MINLIFPKRCPICDGIITGEKLICNECVNIPRRVRKPRCMKCSKHLDSDEIMYCRDCEKHKKHYARGIALYEYDSIKDSINNFKNASRPEFASFYADRIVHFLGSEIKDFNADALIPIPLHISKFKKRGYNQSKLIADEISKRLGIPVLDNVLQRKIKTKEQKKLDDTDRQKNLVGAFHMPQNGVKLYNVILVDDVYTTGSTIDEAARTLLDGGVEKVYFVTVAIGHETMGKSLK